MLRFYVADVNRVVTNAAANASHYRDLVSDRPSGWEVLALSCFAAERKAARTSLRLLFDERFELLGEPRRLPQQLDEDDE